MSGDPFTPKSWQMLHFKNRAPMPPGSRTSPKPPDDNLNTVALETVGGAELGTVEYKIETVHSLGFPWLAQTAPFLYARGLGGVGSLPKLLVIYGFHSHYEHSYKGIGSAMLRELVHLAEIGECHWIVVVNGINPDAYEAFDFKRIDTLDTWCISTAKLRARLAGRSSRWGEV